MLGSNVENHRRQQEKGFYFWNLRNTSWWAERKILWACENMDWRDSNLLKNGYRARVISHKNAEIARRKKVIVKQKRCVGKYATTSFAEPYGAKYWKILLSRSYLFLWCFLLLIHEIFNIFPINFLKFSQKIAVASVLFFRIGFLSQHFEIF